MANLCPFYTAKTPVLRTLIIHARNMSKKCTREMHPETKNDKKMHPGNAPGEANCRKNAPGQNFQNAPGEQKSKKKAEKKHPGHQKAKKMQKKSTRRPKKHPEKNRSFLGAFFLPFFRLFSAFAWVLFGCFFSAF